MIGEGTVSCEGRDSRAGALYKAADPSVGTTGGTSGGTSGRHAPQALGTDRRKSQTAMSHQPQPLWRTLARRILGPDTPGRLPDRIRRSIHDQQHQAEALIAWAQLAILIFFAVFYFLSPKTSMSTDFMPVPIALGTYAVFILGRLAWVSRRLPPRWFVLLSIVADMALLMGLIWSFHLQYGQSAPFYLKAPTLLYVFIFIALRALRFEPMYVVVAGLTAALGWGGLLLYALVGDVPSIHGPRVTHDYVAYMTSNTVLIGAEVDKIVSILVVTVLLALGLMRARRMLERAVADNTAARDLSRFVSADVAQRVAEADTAIRPGDAEVRMATVMFTDIEGFSTLSERVSPAELLQILNAYFSAVSEIIDRHGGLIAQFIGDALMVVYSGETHARRAVSAAAEIVATVKDLPLGDGGHRVRTRAGLNTGLMTLGTVGSHNRLIFTAHGDDVNVAARLEQLNKDHGTYILMSESTMESADLQDAARPVGTVKVRGRQGETAIYTVDIVPPLAVEATAGVAADRVRPV